MQGSWQVGYGIVGVIHWPTLGHKAPGDEAAGHWRAISPGIARSMTVTRSASTAQLRAVKGAYRSDSQADSAGSIPVTRSVTRSAVTRSVARSRQCPAKSGGLRP